MRYLILTLLLILPLSISAQEPNVIQQYDRFENRTRYWTRPTLVARDLDLTVHLTFKGQGAGHDVDGLFLIFTSKNSDWQYLKNSRLFMLVDGERLDLGSARFQDNDIKTGYSSVEVKEVLSFPVKYTTLQKISQGQDVEVRLGTTEFQLSRSFLASLKDLLGKFKAVKVK